MAVRLALAEVLAENGRRFLVQHGQSSAFIYREQRMGRTGLFIKWAEALNKIPKIDAVVQGHWHQFIHIHANKQHLIQLPCWQLFTPTRYALREFGKFQPDIGAVIIFVDEKARIRVWHYLYDPPKTEVREIEA